MTKIIYNKVVTKYDGSVVTIELDKAGVFQMARRCEDAYTSMAFGDTLKITFRDEIGVDIGEIVEGGIDMCKKVSFEVSGNELTHLIKGLDEVNKADIRNDDMVKIYINFDTSRIEATIEPAKRDTVSVKF